MRLAMLVILFLAGCYQPDPTKIEVVTDGPAGSPEDASTTADSGPNADLAMPPSGCTGGGGVRLGAAWGCLGPFTVGNAAGLCRAGCSLCQDATGITACSTTPKFYAGKSSGYYIGSKASETCGASAVNQLLFGCGSAGRGSTKMCGGFAQVTDVGGGSAWTSADGTLSSASNSDPAQGVLCCCP